MSRDFCYWAAPPRCEVLDRFGCLNIAIALKNPLHWARSRVNEWDAWLQQEFRQAEALTGFAVNWVPLTRNSWGCEIVERRLHIGFERLKNWLLSCETKLDFWPKFKLVLARNRSIPVLLPRFNCPEQCPETAEWGHIAYLFRAWARL